MLRQIQKVEKLADAIRSWWLAQDLLLVFMSSTFLLILIIALSIIGMIH